MSLKGPRQYSILIKFIPKHLRSKQALKEYLEHSFPQLVRAVYITVNTKKLEDNVKKRVKVLTNLEHALAVFNATGKRPTHRASKCGCCCRCCQKLDSIDTYRKKLIELNTLVASEINKIKAEGLPSSPGQGEKYSSTIYQTDSATVHTFIVPSSYFIVPDPIRFHRIRRTAKFE